MAGPLAAGAALAQNADPRVAQAAGLDATAAQAQAQAQGQAQASSTTPAAAPARDGATSTQDGSTPAGAGAPAIAANGTATTSTATSATATEASTSAAAQQQPAPAAAPPAPAASEPRNDARLDPAEPDFTLITLPTTLRLPQFKSAFRVTHRFTRPLGDGSFGDLASDFFALDSGAQIGLEYRFGILPGVQIGINRTSERTMQMFGQYDVREQEGSWPVSLSAWGSIDGTNNFKDSYSPALGLIISRKIARHAAFYLEPIWVNNSNPLPSDLTDHNSTFLLGIGGRVRVRPTVYVVVEAVPRVAGYDPGTMAASFAIEKRVGGHSFQMNFGNALGTTMGQIARGGPENREWYLGFNITRKFF
jgi:hypothetical protein